MFGSLKIELRGSLIQVYYCIVEVTEDTFVKLQASSEKYLYSFVTFMSNF